MCGSFSHGLYICGQRKWCRQVRGISLEKVRECLLFIDCYQFIRNWHSLGVINVSKDCRLMWLFLSDWLIFSFVTLSVCYLTLWQKTRVRGKGKVSKRKGGVVKLEWEWLRGMKRRARESGGKQKRISHVSVTQSDVFWIEWAARMQHANRWHAS